MDTRPAPTRPRIAVPLGDPNGIGPEIALKAALDAELRAAAQMILMGDAAVIEYYAHRLGCERELRGLVEAGAVEIDSVVSLAEAPRPGTVSADAGRATTSLKSSGEMIRLFMTIGTRDGVKTGDLMGAIRAMESGRELITVADTIERAERAVRLMVRHGVTAIRSHVDVKVDNGLDSIEALLEVKARTSDIVDVQICAMLDWPLSGDIGKQHLALGRNAIRLGADLIGGCPHLDENTVEAHIAKALATLRDGLQNQWLSIGIVSGLATQLDFLF